MSIKVADPGLAVAVLPLLCERPRHPARDAGAASGVGRGGPGPVPRRLAPRRDPKLLREGRIEPTRRERVGARPERTVNMITEAGTATLTGLLRRTPGETVHGYPRFPAAFPEPPLPPVAVLGSGHRPATWRSERDWVVRIADEIESRGVSRSATPTGASRGEQR